MTPELAQFSDWTLALLPRLFLYPGGVWAFVALLALRLAEGGPAAVRPRALANGLRGSQVSAAAAWAALALLPLPGTELLPFPIDRLALAGLIVFSLLVDRWEADGVDAPATWEQGAVGEPSLTIAFGLAIMAPAAQGRSLLNVESSLADWLALAAVVAGLWALPGTPHVTLSGQLRLLAWLGLAAHPFWILDFGFWIREPGLQTWTGVAWVSLIYTAAIVLLGIQSKIGVPSGPPKSKISGLMCWGLAVAALLAALVV